MRRYANWPSRALYYLSRLLGTQLSAGEGYEDVSGVVGIHILSFDLFPDEDQALWCFEPRDAHRPHVALGTALQWNVLELPKAERLWRNRGLAANAEAGRERSLRATRAWATFFEHWAEESIMADIQHEPVAKAMGRIIELSADEEARRLAFVRERAIRDEKAALRYAREEGRDEGLKQGLEKGLEQGESTILRRQLNRRFGPLPEWAEQRLAGATTDQLEAWADAVLEAATLEGVLGAES